MVIDQDPGPGSAGPSAAGPAHQPRRARSSPPRRPPSAPRPGPPVAPPSDRHRPRRPAGRAAAAADPAERAPTGDGGVTGRCGCGRPLLAAAGVAVVATGGGGGVRLRAGAGSSSPATRRPSRPGRRRWTCPALRQDVAASVVAIDGRPSRRPGTTATPGRG